MKVPLPDAWSYTRTGVRIGCRRFACPDHQSHIHEAIRLQINGEAFNLLNHLIPTSVAGTYSQYTAASTAATSTCKGTAPAGAPLQGCISPFTGTGVNAFGAVNGTNNTLYGPRQLQVAAKLFF